MATRFCERPRLLKTEGWLTHSPFKYQETIEALRKRDLG